MGTIEINIKQNIPMASCWCHEERLKSYNPKCDIPMYEKRGELSFWFGYCWPYGRFIRVVNKFPNWRPNVYQLLKSDSETHNVRWTMKADIIKLDQALETQFISL